MSDAGQVAMFLALGATALGIFFGPLGSALARRLGGGGDPEPELSAELDDLRDRVQRLEAQQDRLADVETRLDFAERLLVQQEPARLESEGGRS